MDCFGSINLYQIIIHNNVSCNQRLVYNSQPKQLELVLGIPLFVSKKIVSNIFDIA